MEAVCCCVRKLVTSLSLFFLAPLRVSPSLSPSFSFPTSTFLSVYPWHALCLFLSRSAPSSLRSVHVDTLDWFCRSHGLRSPTRIQRLCLCKCVCAFACGGVSVSSSIDEIWAVKYECWVVFWCHTVMSLMHGVVVKNVRVHKHLHAAFIVYDK